MLVREMEIIRMQKITPRKRIIKLEKLYLLNITIIKNHANWLTKMHPKITNNSELRFEPNKPKAFKAHYLL